MRLLKFDNGGRLVVSKNLVQNTTCYAILSHTWGADDDEVTFQDLQNGFGESKAGYEKIRFCGEQAKRDGLEYFWVDTCSINKADFTELSEAITSMFRWYNAAKECYVYLSDVSVGDDDNAPTDRTWELAFRDSTWFTRGWTLQELIAPRSVQFYSREGTYLGDKKTLGKQIHEITGVPISALRGASLSEFSVDERLRWARDRQTRKVEDKAYSLLGIFDVFMPLIYGEGEHAFVRLKEEINMSSRRLQNQYEANHDLLKVDEETNKGLRGQSATDTPQRFLDLFTSCVDSYRSVQAVHASEKAFKILETKFKNQQDRLITWGEACGINNNYEYHTRAGESKPRPRIVATLECIQNLFLDEAELSRNYGLKRNTRTASSHPEFLRPGKWAIYDETGFSRLVKDLKDLNDDLESLTHQTGARRTQQVLFEKETEKVESLENLSLMEQAGQDDSDIVSDTASLRLRSVREGSTPSLPPVPKDPTSIVTVHFRSPSGTLMLQKIDGCFDTVAETVVDRSHEMRFPSCQRCGVFTTKGSVNPSRKTSKSRPRSSYREGHMVRGRIIGVVKLSWNLASCPETIFADTFFVRADPPPRQPFDKGRL